MKRREFVVVAGSAVMSWPLVVHAQQSKVPTIGVLVLGNPDPEPFFTGLREGLQRLGYIDGQNIRTARALGLDVPQVLFARADRVIE